MPVITEIFDSGFWSVVIEYLIRICIVAAGFIIFKIIISKIVKLMRKFLIKKQVKNTFHSFIISLVKAFFWLIMILMFLQMLQVPLTPLVAALGALGIGIGLALKDHMANIAGGIMIAINKQFEVGDYIRCDDMEGKVEDVELFFTRLKTRDNKIIFAPNSLFASNNVYNYSKDNIRRVDISIGVSYNSKIEKVKKVVYSFMDSNKMIKKKPESFVGITDFGDSSINLTIRAWTDTESYWDVYFYLNEKIKTEFEKNGIEIPFPQMDVHVNKS